MRRAPRASPFDVPCSATLDSGLRTQDFGLRSAPPVRPVRAGTGAGTGATSISLNDFRPWYDGTAPAPRGPPPCSQQLCRPLCRPLHPSPFKVRRSVSKVPIAPDSSWSQVRITPDSSPQHQPQRDVSGATGRYRELSGPKAYFLVHLLCALCGLCGFALKPPPVLTNFDQF